MKGIYGRRPKDSVADGARPFHRWTGGSCAPQTFGQFKTEYPMIEMVDSCRIWERHCEPEIQPQISADRRPMHMTCQVTEDRLTPAISSEMESVEDMIRRLLPTPAPPPVQAAPKHSDRDILMQQLMETICPPMLVAQERPPTNGNAVTQLVPSGNSHGGGHYPTRVVVRLHRGVFFMRRMDTYYGAMSGFRRVISVLAYRMGGGTQ